MRMKDTSKLDRLNDRFIKKQVKLNHLLNTAYKKEEKI